MHVTLDSIKNHFRCKIKEEKGGGRKSQEPKMGKPRSEATSHGRLEGILPSFNLIGESKSLSMVLWLMIKTTEYDPTASRMRGSDA